MHALFKCSIGKLKSFIKKFRVLEEFTLIIFEWQWLGVLIFARNGFFYNINDSLKPYVGSVSDLDLIGIRDGLAHSPDRPCTLYIPESHLFTFIFFCRGVFPSTICSVIDILSRRPRLEHKYLREMLYWKWLKINCYRGCFGSAWTDILLCFIQQQLIMKTKKFVYKQYTYLRLNVAADQLS